MFIVQYVKPPWRNGLACWTSNSKVVGSSPTGGEILLLEKILKSSLSSQSSFFSVNREFGIQKLNPQQEEAKRCIVLDEKEIKQKSEIRLCSSVIVSRSRNSSLSTVI